MTDTFLTWLRTDCDPDEHGESLYVLTKHYAMEHGLTTNDALLLAQRHRDLGPCPPFKLRQK